MLDYNHEMTAYVAMTIGSLIFFLWVYIVGAERLLKYIALKHYMGLAERRRNMACSGITSSVNAVIMFATSVYLLLTHNLHENICWTDDFYVRLLSCVEMGCYFADSLVLLHGSNERTIILYLLHHLSIVLGSYGSIVYGVFAYFLCLRGINELSVPFQHIRAVLYDMKLKDSRIYFINGLTFIFAFFFARICVIPITVYSVYTIVGTPEYEGVNLFCKIVLLGGAITIDTLNVYWFSLISKGAYKILFKKKQV